MMLKPSLLWLPPSSSTSLTRLWPSSRLHRLQFQQLVLLLILVRAVIGSGGWRSGVAAGAASVASLVVGMETAPFLALGGGAAFLVHRRNKAGTWSCRRRSR